MSIFTPAQCDEGRHLLRAILRECTYLPDAWARRYLSRHAVNRFGDYAPGVKPDPVLQERRRLQIAKARKTLSELRRANAGELKPLQKVLHLSYARRGKRRHELLHPLANASPTDTDTGTGTDTDTPTKQPLPQLTPQHRTLLVSQLRTRPPTIRSQLRSLALTIPDKNAWERPMPQKRIANTTKEWYATLLDRTLVPLPRPEWESLRDLALGTIQFTGTIPRRTPVVPQQYSLSPLEVTLGVAPVDTPQAIVNMSANSIHAHTLTRRYMRRCWASVFAQCPVMDWDSASKTWSVEWGCDVLTQHQVKRAIDMKPLTP